MDRWISPQPGDGPGQARVQASGGATPALRRRYTPPVLEVLGDVRELTLGPSAGIGDSIDPATRQAV